MSLRMESMARRSEGEPASAELRGIIEAASQALIERDQHVILRGAAADLLAHLARQITLEMSDRLGEMVTIHWLARLEDTLEVVNNLVAALPLSRAVAPARNDTPTRLLVVRIDRSLEPDPWRLLGRLISNFPGLRLRLLLIPEGAPEEALRELGSAVTRQLLAIPIRGLASDGSSGQPSMHPVPGERPDARETGYAPARARGTTTPGAGTTAPSTGAASPAVVRSPRQQGMQATDRLTPAAPSGRTGSRPDPAETALPAREARAAPGPASPGPASPEQPLGGSLGGGLIRGLTRVVIYLLLATLAVAVASMAYPQQAGVLVDLLRQIPGAEQWLPASEPEPAVPAPPLPNRPAVRVEPAPSPADGAANETVPGQEALTTPPGVDASGVDVVKSDAARADALRTDPTHPDARKGSAGGADSPTATPPTPPDPIRNEDRPARKERRAR